MQIGDRTRRSATCRQDRKCRALCRGRRVHCRRNLSLLQLASQHQKASSKSPEALVEGLRDESVMHSSVACCSVNVTTVWKKSEKRCAREKFSYREFAIEIVTRFS